MAELTGGELVARVLAREGVGAIFTLCGGHVLPIYDACLRHGIRIVDVRHEQAAAHAADAWARLTRGLGVAVVVPGPGVTDAVTGVANAHAARSPLLLIGGGSPLGLKGRGALQEMDQVSLLAPITKGAWAVPEPRLIAEYLARAVDVALSGQPGPVFVEIAVDLLMSTVDERDAPFPPPGPRRRPEPAPEAVERVAALLAAAERPAIVAGSGVYWDGAWDALAGLAERRGAARVHERHGTGVPPARSSDGVPAGARARLAGGRPGPRPRDAARLPARVRAGAGVRGGGAGRDGRRGRRRLRAEPHARRGPRGGRRPHPRGPAGVRGGGGPGPDRGLAPAPRRQGSRRAREAGRPGGVGPDARSPTTGSRPSWPPSWTSAPASSRTAATS